MAVGKGTKELGNILAISRCKRKAEGEEVGYGSGMEETKELGKI
jgi:hypothetical protein